MPNMSIIFKISSEVLCLLSDWCILYTLGEKWLNGLVYLYFNHSIPAAIVDTIDRFADIENNEMIFNSVKMIMKLSGSFSPALLIS